MLKWDARHAPPLVRGEFDVERMPRDDPDYLDAGLLSLRDAFIKTCIQFLIYEVDGLQYMLVYSIGMKFELWQVMEANDLHHELPGPSMR